MSFQGLCTELAGQSYRGRGGRGRKFLGNRKVLDGPVQHPTPHTPQCLLPQHRLHRILPGPHTHRQAGSSSASATQTTSCLSPSVGHQVTAGSPGAFSFASQRFLGTSHVPDTVFRVREHSARHAKGNHVVPMAVLRCRR